MNKCTSRLMQLLAKEYRTAQALAQQQQVAQNTKPLFRAIAASDYTALLSVAVKLVHSVSVSGTPQLCGCLCLFAHNCVASVKNVRVHYEDTVTVPGAPILIGLTIDSISSHTVDGWFRERALFQACDVRGVSLYMNTDWDVRKHKVTTDEDIAERLVRTVSRHSLECLSWCVCVRLIPCTGLALRSRAALRSLAILALCEALLLPEPSECATAIGSRACQRPAPHVRARPVLCCACTRRASARLLATHGAQAAAPHSACARQHTRLVALRGLLSTGGRACGAAAAVDARIHTQAPGA